MAGVWRIAGYNSNELEFECRIPEGTLSEAEVIVLLQRLAARHLDPDEVVSSSLRKNAKSYVGHLEITKSYGKKNALMTRGNPFYTAAVEDGNDGS